MGRLQLWPDWRLSAWEAVGGLVKQGVLCNWLGKQIWLFKFHPKLKTRAKLGKLVVTDQVLAVWGQLLQRLQVGFHFYMWSVHYHCPHVYSISDQNGNASLSHMIAPGLSTRKCVGSFPGNSQTCVSVHGTFPDAFRSQLALLFLPVFPCLLGLGSALSRIAV